MTCLIKRLSTPPHLDRAYAPLLTDDMRAPSFVAIGIKTQEPVVSIPVKNTGPTIPNGS